MSRRFYISSPSTRSDLLLQENLSEIAAPSQGIDPHYLKIHFYTGPDSMTTDQSGGQCFSATLRSTPFDELRQYSTGQYIKCSTFTRPSFIFGVRTPQIRRLEQRNFSSLAQPLAVKPLRWINISLAVLTRVRDSLMHWRHVMVL